MQIVGESPSYATVVDRPIWISEKFLALKIVNFRRNFLTMENVSKCCKIDKVDFCTLVFSELFSYNNIILNAKEIF